MRLWILIASLLIRYADQASPLRGGVSELVPIYRYAYFGPVNKDMGGVLGSIPIVANMAIVIPTQSESGTVFNEVFQLRYNGELPEALSNPQNGQVFSAILRYNSKLPGDVTRVRNWIGENKHLCREIFVVNYPVTEEDYQKLNTISESFRDPSDEKIRPVLSEGNAHSLEELLQALSKDLQPHDYSVTVE